MSWSSPLDPVMSARPMGSSSTVMLFQRSQASGQVSPAMAHCAGPQPGVVEKRQVSDVS
jgi:hypothetical protein